MQPERVFIDTNVLISAIVFNGNERALMHLALDGKIIPVFAEIVLEEARRILGIKFPDHAPRLQWELSLLEYELVPGPDPSFITIAAGLVRDPGDVEVLASILAAKPDHAVTGDKDLLTDEVKAVAPLCRCADFLESQRNKN